MSTSRLATLCFPVWSCAHLADPYMAAIRRILKRRSPEAIEAVLIGSVFTIAQHESYREMDHVN